MSKLRWLLILTMSLSAGCKSTTVVVDTSCFWVKPITTTAAERKVMTRYTKEQIATLNDMWDLKCGKRTSSAGSAELGATAPFLLEKDE